MQPAGGRRLDTATILASRRAKSVSNPVNVPPPPGSDLSRSNTAQIRSNTTRSARSTTTGSGGTPLRVKTPLGTAGRIAGVGANGETAAASATAPMTLRSRPSLPKPRGQESPQVPQQSAPQSPPQPLQNAGRYVPPLVLPATPAPAQGGCSSPLQPSPISMSSREQTIELKLFFESLFRRKPHTIL